MGVKNDITIIRLILGHWAGKLSEPEKKELDNWLAQSEKHRIYFQKWCDDERQNELLSKIGCYDPGEGWQQVVRKRNMRRNRRWWLVAAASVAILFGGLAVYRYSKIPVSLPLASEETSIYPGKRMARLITPSGETVLLDTLRQTDTQQMKLHNDQGRVVIQAACGDANGDQPVYHCLEVPRGGEFSFLLPDSTTVFLNAESRLRFPDRFVPGSERIVYLSGEAYFDVKRDPPFSLSGLPGTLGGKSDRYFLQCQGVPRRHERSDHLDQRNRIDGDRHYGTMDRPETGRTGVLRRYPENTVAANRGRELLYSLERRRVCLLPATPGRGHENTGMLVSVRHPLSERSIEIYSLHGENQSSCFHPGGLAHLRADGRTYIRHKRKGGYCQEKIKKATASSCTRTGCKLV